MTVRVSGVPFDDLVPNIKQALDDALAGTLSLQQGALGEANPKDTGRMASSWFIGHNTPRRDTRPENWGTPAKRKTIEGKSVIVQQGSKRYEKEEYTQKISFSGTWYISNNVPYASIIALDYPAAAPGQKDWYTSISNQTSNVFIAQWNKVKP
jgi:hypothetical protein